jgi:hypothetical protein
MGYYSEQDIQNQEDEDMYNYQQEDDQEEFHFHTVINEFQSLLNQYGSDVIVRFLQPEVKFNLLEAIIKSNGNLMKE